MCGIKYRYCCFVYLDLAANACYNTGVTAVTSRKPSRRANVRLLHSSNMKTLGCWGKSRNGRERAIDAKSERRDVYPTNHLTPKEKTWMTKEDVRHAVMLEGKLEKNAAVIYEPVHKTPKCFLLWKKKLHEHVIGVEHGQIHLLAFFSSLLLRSAHNHVGFALTLNPTCPHVCAHDGDTMKM